MTMNPSAKAEVDRILAAGPDSITEDERAFLTARRTYLTGEQKVNFGISDETPVSTDEVPSAPRKRKAASTDEA